MNIGMTVRSTTILAVRKNGKVAMGGDGQVSVGDTIMKSNATKVRSLADGRVLAGFAGAAADAFTLFEKFEGIEQGMRGRVVVDKFLRMKDSNSIFAIGDNASFAEENSGMQAPATAFIAEQQADAVAANISRAMTSQPLAKYKISIPGYVISCGGKYAVARIFGFTFSGFFGWVVKKLIDLKYFSSILPFRKAFSLWLGELRLFARND